MQERIFLIITSFLIILVDPTSPLTVRIHSCFRAEPSPEAESELELYPVSTVLIDDDAYWEDVFDEYQLEDGGVSFEESGTVRIMAVGFYSS